MGDDVTRLRDTVAMGGGPAFPQSDLTAYGMGPSDGNNSGMSLRDYLAARAMQGLVAEMAGALAEGDAKLGVALANTARLSWAVADAMLRERFRR